MVWRLAHPVRGMLAGLAVWVLVGTALGFGVGIPELLIMTALAVMTTVVVGRRGSKTAMAFDRVDP